MMSPTRSSTDGGVALAPGVRSQQSPPSSPQRRSDEAKSQCSSLSDAENYEWTAGEPDADADSGDRNVRDIGTRSPSNNIHRHTWLRTSLRRSSPNNGKRQLGSNALASQLYRSSSFNSSGRSSTCDTTDDMYSDASLEEDVHDLHHKVSPNVNQYLKDCDPMFSLSSHNADICLRFCGTYDSHIFVEL
ncbi:hypothetical protein WA026_023724 [Henosepilachna vigintioctopunctata]|uniref:Uncharacterized protein n=1 Tax=Henosepilachna vigintioctopunctata TaxID=420089 RepID=A0AAW1V675_9CUCU